MTRRPVTPAPSLSLDDGKQLWKHESDGGKYKAHKKNSFASSTPAVAQTAL